jgi:ribonuclease G
VLKRGQSIIVQVSKEPISTKGPRVTAQVSIAGRFVVFMPFASRVGVSRKIGERAERQRLREQVQKVLPKNSGGVIVRTDKPLGEEQEEQIIAALRRRKRGWCACNLFSLMQFLHAYEQR